MYDPMHGMKGLDGPYKDKIMSVIDNPDISIDELMEAHDAGSLQEVFGSGTAAVISPVGEIKYDDKIITIAGNEVGPFANKYYKAITDLQYGQTEDAMGWIEPVV